MNLTALLGHIHYLYCNFKLPVALLPELDQSKKILSPQIRTLTTII